MGERKPADARRREIADAALRIIADRGLPGFTSLALAREVGVTDAALFRHFPTKEAIVLAAIERVEEVLFEGFPPGGEDPLARLGAFFRRRVEVIRDNPGIARLVGSEELARAAPPEGVARVLAMRQRSQAFVRACLAAADRDGALARGVRPDEAAVLVLGALLALAHAGHARAPGAGDLPERVWLALDRLLRAPPGGRRGSQRARVTPA